MTSYSSWRDIPRPIRAFIAQFLNANGDMSKVTSTEETITEVIRQNILVLGKHENIYMDADIIKLFNERNNHKTKLEEYKSLQEETNYNLTMKILGLDNDTNNSLKRN